MDEHGWEIADLTFKILGWILIAGTIRAIAHISDHWLLRGLAHAIFAVLGLALAAPISKAATIIRNRFYPRFKRPFLVGILVWLVLVMTLWSAISLLVEDITNFLPPTSDGTD